MSPPNEPLITRGSAIIVGEKQIPELPSSQACSRAGCRRALHEYFSLPIEDLFNRGATLMKHFWDSVLDTARNQARSALERVSPLFPRGSQVFLAGAEIHFLKAANAYQQSIALVTAHRLEIFDRLASEPRSSKELAKEMGADAKCLSILLGVLMEMGFVICKSGKYHNTGVSELLLVSGQKFHVASLLDVTFDQWKYWGDLEETIKTGDGHPKLAVYSDENQIYPSYIRSCCEVLAYPSTLFMREFDTSKIRNAVAGTVGTTFIKALREANPEVDVTFCCLPHFIKELPDVMEKHQMDFPYESVETTADPDTSQWGSQEDYDLIFFARKFAFAGPEHGIAYLNKASRVIRPGGNVVLWEPVVENFRGFEWMKNTVAIQDAIMGQGEPLYSKEQIRGFVRDAGFTAVRTIDVLHGNVSFTVGERSGKVH